jgi:hypothetical protein
MEPYTGYFSQAMVSLNLFNEGLFVSINVAALLPSSISIYFSFHLWKELPMIYLVVLMNFMIVEQGSPNGNPKYPRLPAFLSALVAVNTMVYYTFQQFYLVFLGTYLFLLLHEIYLVYTLVFMKGIGGRITRNMNFSSLFIYLGASVFWMVDMFYCDISSLGYGMTFHVIWHFGAGFGAYLGIVSMENCRCVALRKSCELRYISGFIPYMKLVQAPKVN